jgi:hypothetical protein
MRGWYGPTAGLIAGILLAATVTASSQPAPPPSQVMPPAIPWESAEPRVTVQPSKPRVEREKLRRPKSKKFKPRAR